MYLQYIEKRHHEVMIQFCINRLRPWVWDLSLVVLPTPCYYLVTRALCHIIKYIHKCYLRTTTQNIRTFAACEAKKWPFLILASYKHVWNFRCVCKSFSLCSVFLVAAVQITKLGDQLLAADSTAGKAVFPISHLQQQYFWWICRRTTINFGISKCSSVLKGSSTKKFSIA